VSQAPHPTIEGLSIEVAWCDSDVPELRVRVGNSFFFGECEVYAPVGEIVGFVESLRAFPARSGDQRFARLGTFGESGAGGGLRLVALGRDSLCRLEMELCRRAGSDLDRVRLAFDAEVEAIEGFVAGMDRLCAAIEARSDGAVGIQASLEARPGVPL